MLLTDLDSELLLLSSLLIAPCMALLSYAPDLLDDKLTYIYSVMWSESQYRLE